MHWVRAALEEENPEAIFFDGLDGALVGIARQQYQPGHPVYLRSRIICELRKQGMSEEDADEWYSFNIEAAWVGPNTPLILESDVDQLGEVCDCGMCEQPDEDDAKLGPCGCTDYHMADCPVLTGRAIDDDFDADVSDPYEM